jgi:hypothetical protein
MYARRGLPLIVVLAAAAVVLIVGALYLAFSTGGFWSFVYAIASGVGAAACWRWVQTFRRPSR